MRLEAPLEKSALGHNCLLAQRLVQTVAAAFDASPACPTFPRPSVGGHRCQVHPSLRVSATPCEPCGSTSARSSRRSPLRRRRSPLVFL